ncbi:choline transporter-like protein 1 isoform X2 [Chironomus tepperi]|uniref:choline transporter-like protein 1 isoform X2 n=1 Tax=Chironomus tepperi TaxID=113505 RepID=UPI00391EEB60
MVRISLELNWKSIEVKSSSERKRTNLKALISVIIFFWFAVLLIAACSKDKFKWLLDDDDEIDAYRGDCGYICEDKDCFRLINYVYPDEDVRDPDIHLDRDPDIDPNPDDDDEDVRDPDIHPDIAPNPDDDDDDDDDLHFGKKKVEKCVNECPIDYTRIGIRCIEAHGVRKLVNILIETSHYIFMMCFIASIISYVFMILFRRVTKHVIWSISAGFMISIVIVIILFGIAGRVGGAVTFGILGLILGRLLFLYRKRVDLTVKLFNETSKVLIDVPAVKFKPIATIIILLIFFVMFKSSADNISFEDTENVENHVDFDYLDFEDILDIVQICNLICFIFITQFTIECHNYILAGTIYKWYFTADKTNFKIPLKKTTFHLFKFHLGSICFGVLLIPIGKVIMSITNGIKNLVKDSQNAVARLITKFPFDYIDQRLSFLIRDAYVIVEKEGTPFCDSGRRAYKLLMDNITDVSAFNRFGDVVLMVCRLLIAMIAGLVGYAVLGLQTKYQEHLAVPIIIGSFLAFLIAHCFVMVFEMTVDTIFVSFCIDLEENDGQTKPYYMTESLKEIIMELKEQTGGTLVFGPKNDEGIENGIDCP